MDGEPGLEHAVLDPADKEFLIRGGAGKDVFVKEAESDHYSVGKWWGGDGAFWDYTKESARKIWKEYLREVQLV